eukprot:GDKJ01015205.1.p1 GENE.GDKJ01015205.1~~GDKJ01015205.1.p1  ORF type:complete len:135 (+),score=1.29 GDKJ01015205.1:157-561(+)
MRPSHTPLITCGPPAGGVRSMRSSVGCSAVRGRFMMLVSSREEGVGGSGGTSTCSPSLLQNSGLRVGRYDMRCRLGATSFLGAVAVLLLGSGFGGGLTNGSESQAPMPSKFVSAFADSVPADFSWTLTPNRSVC